MRERGGGCVGREEAVEVLGGGAIDCCDDEVAYEGQVLWDMLVRPGYSKGESYANPACVVFD